MPDPAEPTFDCIVLGAGMAGVTAARNLQQKGQRVLLLEGSERIGGRMNSNRGLVPDPDQPGQFLPIEAGAEYIHVAKKGRYKAFWKEIEARGFTTSRFPKTTKFLLDSLLDKLLGKEEELARNRLFFEAWGKTLTTDEALEQDKEIQKAAPLLFLLEIKDLFDPDKQEDIAAGEFVKKQDYQGRGVVMGQYTLSAHTPGLLDDPPPGLPPGQPNPNDTISVAGLLKDEIQDQLIEPAEFRLEVEADGRRRIPGYDSLPRAICDQFLAAGGTLRKSDPGTTAMKVVRVEKTVGNIVVTTRSGEQFVGRSALSTFSVGMLDPTTGEGAAIFGPLLDAEKRQALEMVKMGAITKFSLVFKERLWAPEATAMTVLSNPEGRARTFFSAFPDRPQGPHVLTGLLMGKDHLAIKDLDDGAAIQLLLDELHRVFGRGGPRWTAETVLAGERDPAGRFVPLYHRQDWQRDEFAKGGNSFLRHHPAGPLGVTRAREALKNPRGTLPLFWAGEATAPAYDRFYQPLAVHGAYISGVEAAADILHYLTVCRGDEMCFGQYYEKKYLKRGLGKKIKEFFEDLFS